jgi:hypothetical protein
VSGGGFRPKTLGEKEEGYSPTQERAEWNRFFRAALALGRRWRGCQVCPPTKRDPNAKLEVHHVVSQQRLKRWCRERGIAKGSFEELKILTDERNTLLPCESCHWLHTYRGRPIPREAIPAHAWAFIDEKGLREEMEREYPPRRELRE